MADVMVGDRVLWCPGPVGAAGGVLLTVDKVDLTRHGYEARMVDGGDHCCYALLSDIRVYAGPGGDGGGFCLVLDPDDIAALDHLYGPEADEEPATNESDDGLSVGDLVVRVTSALGVYPAMVTGIGQDEFRCRFVGGARNGQTASYPCTDLSAWDSTMPRPAPGLYTITPEDIAKAFALAYGKPEEPAGEPVDVGRDRDRHLMALNAAVRYLAGTHGTRYGASIRDTLEGFLDSVNERLR